GGGGGGCRRWWRHCRCLPPAAGVGSPPRRRASTGASSGARATATLRSGKQVGGSDGGGGSSGGEVDGRDGGAVQAADIKEKKNVRRSKVAFSSVILDLVGLTVVVPLSPALFDCYSKHDSSGLYSSVLSCVTCYQHIIGVPARFHSVLFGGPNDDDSCFHPHRG
ncbi:hypothetical protein O3P69_011339, partial [Scylla paramamosain]